MQSEHGVGEELSGEFASLKQILLELGLPVTRDRTPSPRIDLDSSDVVICVLSSSPDRYLPVLLEGGRRCPGHMLLCLSPSWVSRSPSPAQPALSSLHVHRAVTFQAGGHTYLDTFDPPCRVTYFLGDCSAEHSWAQLGEGLDCPTSGSPHLNMLTEDVLLTRQLLGREGTDVPPMLALSYGPGPQQTSQGPGLTLVHAQEKTDLQTRMKEAIDTFLQLPELKDCDQVSVQPSSAGWGSQESVSVVRSGDGDGILRAAQALLPNIKAGESVLLTGCVPSIQPFTVPKVVHKAVRVPDVARAKLSLRISATVCRTAQDQPLVTQVLCWVDRAGAHPRAPPTGLQSLRETLQDWGFTQAQQLASLEELIKQKAVNVMQVIMAHQSEISDTQRGGAHVQTDLIGVEFSLAVLEGSLQPLFLGVKAHTRGVQATPLTLLDPSELDRAMGPLLQAVCHRSHSLLLAGKTLLVIGGGGSKREGIWLTARKHNVKIVVISHNAENAARPFVHDFLLYNYKDHQQDAAHADAIVDLLRQRDVRVDGCLTFICSNTILTAMVNAKLGLHGDTVDAIAIAKMKSKTQLHLGALRIEPRHLPDPSAYAARCEHVRDRDGLRRTMERVGLPAVMKMEYSAGGISVKLVESARGCEEHFGRLHSVPAGNADSLNRGFISEPLLMEYVGGDKYVVDLVLSGGKLLAAFVSDCGPSALPYFLNSSHVMPSDLSPEKRTQVAVAAYQCCLHCGLENGNYNVDIKLTERGPKLIEINPRTGGNYLPAWIKTVYGFDMYMCAFLIASGVRPLLWTPEPRGYYVGISSPNIQHIQAMKNTPAFDEILQSLKEKGLVRPSMISDIVDPSIASSTLNLASFRADKEEAFRNVLICSRVLGLDTEEYPVEHFLTPLMKRLTVD